MTSFFAYIFFWIDSIEEIIQEVFLNFYIMVNN